METGSIDTLGCYGKNPGQRQLYQWNFFSSWFYKGLLFYGLATCSRSWSLSHDSAFFVFPLKFFVSPIFLSKLHFTQFYSLGVTPDFLGNLFWHTLPKLAPTRKAAVTALFEEMRQWYQDNGVENRLLTLTELMIRKKANSSPKLRSKAAEARALVPFGVWFLTCALTISIFVFLLEGNSLWSFLFFLKGEFLFGSLFCFSPAKVCSEALDWWQHGRSDYHCMC